MQAAIIMRFCFTLGTHTHGLTCSCSSMLGSQARRLPHSLRVFTGVFVFTAPRNEAAVPPRLRSTGIRGGEEAALLYSTSGQAIRFHRHVECSRVVPIKEREREAFRKSFCF